MGTMTIMLPNGIRQSDGVWTKEVEISEMVGEDEDILVDQTRDSAGKGTFLKSGPARLTDILSRCTVRIGTETRPEGKDRFNLPNFFLPCWDRAFSNDRVFGMVRLRQLTMGNEYTFSANCSSCKKELPNVMVKLNELDVKELPLEEASKSSHDLTLPKSGDRIAWKFLSGAKDEEEIEKIVKTMKSEFISAILFRRIVEVNGGKVPGGLTYLKRMNTGDRRYMANHFDNNEGGIDTDIQITCDGCGQEFSKKMEIMSGSFFFPSATPSDSNSTSAPLPSVGDTPQTSSSVSL